MPPLPRSLAALAAVVVSASAAAVRGGGGPTEVALLAPAASAALSPAWFGYNPGDHAATTGPWTDPAFNSAVAALRPGNLRYPSGTAANYWSWKDGCETPCKTKGASTLAKFAQTLVAANASAVLVVNMLTDPLASQLQFLAAAEAAGVPVVAVELGNEFCEGTKSASCDPACPRACAPNRTL
jgi:hypothetical protein